jgi:hypothetical protein
MIIKEWKPSLEGWSGVIKYKALDPIQTIKATRLFLEHNGPEKLNKVLSNLDYISDLIPFLTPLLQEVDLISDDGQKVGINELVENGEFVGIWSEFAANVVLSSFKKKSAPKNKLKK